MGAAPGTSGRGQAVAPRAVPPRTAAAPDNHRPRTPTVLLHPEGLAEQHWVRETAVAPDGMWFGSSVMYFSSLSPSRSMKSARIQAAPWGRRPSPTSTAMTEASDESLDPLISRAAAVAETTSPPLPTGPGRWHRASFLLQGRGVGELQLAVGSLLVPDATLRSPGRTSSKPPLEMPASPLHR